MVAGLILIFRLIIYKEAKQDQHTIKNILMTDRNKQLKISFASDHNIDVEDQECRQATINCYYSIS